jgi:hypothetical protein
MNAPAASCRRLFFSAKGAGSADHAILIAADPGGGRVVVSFMVDDVGVRVMMAARLGSAGARCAFVAMMACASGVAAHEHTAPWVDESTHEQGVYVHVDAPHVLRTMQPFALRVQVQNIAGDADLTVNAIRIRPMYTDAARTYAVNQVLPTLRDHYLAYEAAHHEMHAAADAAPRDAIMKLMDQARTQLQAIRSEPAVRITQAVDPADLPVILRAYHAQVMIDLQFTNGAKHTLVREVVVPFEAPLPRGATPPTAHLEFDAVTRSWRIGESSGRGSIGAGRTWFSGDQHLHTAYSLDAFVLSGTTDTVATYADTARGIGLDWAVITDHSNVNVTWGGTDYYTPAQHAAGTQEAADFRAQENYLVLYSQEMGAGSTGLLNLPAHVLALPVDVDSMGYLANPSSGLLFGLANCEPEQTIIDRIDAAGGATFIAHPFDSSSLAYAQWSFNNGATGWAGFEIFNSDLGVLDGPDEQSISQWHALLNDVAAPVYGALADRPDYPSPFPVGLGNSDAHEPGLIGNTFTYAWLDAPTRADVGEALLAGRCVASNGPLVYGLVNGASSGDVGALEAESSPLTVRLHTTAEFGPVGDYVITVFVNGAVRTTIPASGSPDFDAAIDVTGLDLQPGDRFITLRADSIDGTWHAIANPIWLAYSCRADITFDGEVSTDDFFALLQHWGPCAVNATCRSDIEPVEAARGAWGDGVVDTGDFFALLQHWGPCE